MASKILQSREHLENLSDREHSPGVPRGQSAHPPSPDCRFSTPSPGTQVHAVILAGDFNAIEDFDRTIPIEHKLTDAYLALGGLEDSDEGFTRGSSAKRN